MEKSLDKDIEILKEFKEKGFASLMIKYNKDRIQTNTMVKTAIENVLSELETYKKIADLLADELLCMKFQYGSIFSLNKKELLDWARKEVENGDT